MIVIQFPGTVPAQMHLHAITQTEGKVLIMACKS